MHDRPTFRLELVAAFVAVCLGAPLTGVAAEKLMLREPATDSRVYNVSTRLDVAGKLQTAAGDGKAVALKLNVDAKSVYSERRLSGTGRDALSLRSIRLYEKAQAEISVSNQFTFPTLQEGHKLIVAQGQREGLQLFSPSGPLTYGELDLLKMPGDSLSVIALLPDEPVEPGDTWKPADWTMQLLTGLEAVEKSALQCKFESLNANVARITFLGEITGASLGASCALKLEGHFLYDIEQKFMTHVQVTQADVRSVGTVSPGIDVLAKVTIDRAIESRPPALTDASQIPLEPNPATLLMLFESPEWRVRFYYPRQWHLYHQTAKFAVLRLVERGNLIAQCDIHALSNAEPGKHVPEEQFQKDVARALGKNFQKIIQADVLKAREGQFVYRVTAVGEAQGLPQQWTYYLVASPDGRQLVFVFSVEAKLAESLGSKDLEMLGGLQFLPPATAPTQALTPVSK